MLSVLNDESRDKPERNEESKCPYERNDALAEVCVEENIREIEPKIRLCVFFSEDSAYESEDCNDRDRCT